MIYIPEKEEIILKNLWITGISAHGFLIKENKGNGEVLGFGWNSDNQLGVESSGRCTVFRKVDLFSNRIIKISVGFWHTMFLNDNNQLFTTGSNYYFQLGWKVKKLKTPKLIPFKRKNYVLDVFVGYYHTIVLNKDLELLAFGLNDKGQLGVGDSKNRTTPTKVVLPEKVITAACGGYHSFFISIEGNIYVCGANGCGQLGIKEKRNICNPRLFKFFRKNKILQICCGGELSLFLTSNFRVYGAGRTFNNASEVYVPKLVESLKRKKIISIKCGKEFSYFRSKYKIWMSGANHCGQLNTGDYKDVDFPILFSIPGKKIIQSEMMYGTSIHFTRKNEVFGCGENDEGQMFCGKLISKVNKVFKLCDIKVKKNHVSETDIENEIRERFEYLTLNKTFEIHF